MSSLATLGQSRIVREVDHCVIELTTILRFSDFLLQLLQVPKAIERGIEHVLF